MATWQPGPGETLLSRAPALFASGVATAVSGKRWFRDSARNDIQHELPGWPEGPAYTALSKGGSGLLSTLKFILRTVFVIVAGILTSQGGSGPVSSGPGKPQDPPNEVEDFPVIWADPGTIARTLPWQLDPARRPKDYRTHLIVTDRRAVVVGLDEAEPVNDEVLWEIARENIADVELMKYARNASDFRIHFTDGSWCRLASNYRGDACRYLTHPFELVAPESLSPELRQAVAEFTADKTVYGDPVITRRPSGHYLVEIRVTEGVSAFAGLITHPHVMGPNGETVRHQPGDA